MAAELKHLAGRARACKGILGLARGKDDTSLQRTWGNTMNLALRRKLRFWNTRLREWRMMAKGLASKRHPVLAHLIPIRRCNLSCTYCNEFDNFSKPVALEELFRRVDLLAGLGTTIVTLSGGEPLLHPHLEEIVRRIRRHGILAGMITNGYLLTPQRIEHLNRAGLDHLQISIDNVQPDEVSKKSLKVLDRKLQMLARLCDFPGEHQLGVGQPGAAPRRRAHRGPPRAGTGLHQHGRHPARSRRPASAPGRAPAGTLRRRSCRWASVPTRASINFRRTFRKASRTTGDAAPAAATSTFAKTAWCTTARSNAAFPAIPLEKYTPEHLAHEYHTQKSCAPHCTVSCVQQVAMLDNWRSPQTRPAFVPVENLLPFPNSLSEG